jgi:hypothetical protein
MPHASAQSYQALQKNKRRDQIPQSQQIYEHQQRRLKIKEERPFSHIFFLSNSYNKRERERENLEDQKK